MLTQQELDILVPLLTPRLIRGLLETGHFSSGEANDFSKVSPLSFLSHYEGGVGRFLNSHPDANPVWDRLSAHIPADKRFNSRERYFRHVHLKDMKQFCALKNDPQAMAMLDSLPKELQPKIKDLMKNVDNLDNQTLYYPQYKDIIKAMSQLRPKDTAGDTPLMFMAMRGHVLIARSLLVAGAVKSINERGACNIEPTVSARFETVSACEGYTALELSVKYQHAEMLALLIDFGADINMNRSAFHPVNMAIAQGDKAAVDILLSKQADLSVKNMVQETPLLFSARVKHKKPAGQAIHDELLYFKTPPPIPAKPEYPIITAITGAMLAVSLGIAVTLSPAMWALLLVAIVPVAAAHQLRRMM